ncbi:hypothetical protein FJT64_022479 [Amphibalanus amphitrite]|uniref:Uncharacterized protein n=1 Tax=Amphibalanus amphitrite TaxID=1232801 RepID=A0A6A4WE84_AMPAM|nr:hypothetical protein FJT64_022479 [Amphibalanus amphitrite]
MSSSAGRCCLLSLVLLMVPALVHLEQPCDDALVTSDDHSWCQGPARCRADPESGDLHRRALCPFRRRAYRFYQTVVASGWRWRAQRPQAGRPRRPRSRVRRRTLLRLQRAECRCEQSGCRPGLECTPFSTFVQLPGEPRSEAVSVACLCMAPFQRDAVAAQRTTAD